MLLGCRLYHTYSVECGINISVISTHTHIPARERMVRQIWVGIHRFLSVCSLILIKTFFGFFLMYGLIFPNPNNVPQAWAFMSELIQSIESYFPSSCKGGLHHNPMCVCGNSMVGCISFPTCNPRPSPLFSTLPHVIYCIEPNCTVTIPNWNIL